MAGLGASLYIGQSGLLSNQAALQSVGNNLANLATPGYHKQDVTLATNRSSELRRGIYIGTGVHVSAVTRRIDSALEDRLRGSIGDQAASAARNDILKQIEALENEFTEIDISSRFNTFLNTWSDLAGNPGDDSLRQVIVSQGETLTSFVRSIREDLGKLRTQVDNTINQSGAAADDLLTRIQEINSQIASAERGSGGAHGLRDQRDILLGELSQYMDISTHEGNNGAIDVFVGSLPVILNGVSRGVELKKSVVNNELQINMIIKDDQSVLDVKSGSIGAMVASRDEDVTEAIAQLDDFSNNLIFEVNKLHSQGLGKLQNKSVGFTKVTGTNRTTDPTRALNDVLSGLKFTPKHGSVQISVRQVSTGQVKTEQFDVNLNGLASDTTLNDLVTSINGVAGFGIGASVTPDGMLEMSTADSDYEIVFGEDTSGVMAALGLNTFFTGLNASDIAVNTVVSKDVSKIAAGRMSDTGQFIAGSNETANAIDKLRETPIESLNGLSLTQLWNKHVEDFSTRQGQTQNQLEADTIVRESLMNQQQAVSGVNADEEAVNLLSYQRAYQGSARFLSVVDELMQTLLSLV